MLFIVKVIEVEMEIGKIMVSLRPIKGAEIIESRSWDPPPFTPILPMSRS